MQAAPALSARRCVRHPAREAVARCAACGGSFCRECASEHEGRLLCAGCLAKAVAAEARPRRDFTPVRRFVTLTAGVLVLWLFFYGLGNLLVKVPVDVHEGTLWNPEARNPR